MLEMVLRRENPPTLFLGMEIGAATMENSFEVPPQTKQNYHMIQQFHSWAYIQINLWFKKIYTPLCSFAAQSLSRVRLYDSMDGSIPGLPVHHHLPELAQTQVHRVGDAIQPSHPLSTHCPPALNLSQHQGLFQWVSLSHQVAKGLALQHHSFQRIFRTDFL